MPPTTKHLQTSISRTGKDYAELHSWIDDPVLKNERHDFTNIWDFGAAIKAKYGEEGLREYIEHLREDMDVKLMKIWGKDAAVRDEALDYYGIRKKGRDYSLDMADIKLLQDAGMSAEDLDHSLKVAGRALDIARRVKADVDMELVGRGALFHDLGKAKTHAIEHGLIGAEMGKALGLPDTINVIMEKHIRGGLTAAEATEFGLPVKDYTLHKLEERIIIYADRLVDIIYDGLVKVDGAADAEKRFEDILSNEIKYGKNDITRERYFGYHREIQGLMGSTAQ
ncbi:MAG: HDIG domain-containing protein [Gammaproteobacteria bacterium]|nr:HDIG domain-containing protein [Rhodocyclaceae bacterium]MBU3908375.1 HDIG domain-containing protein [Gammaproteobacteria bacterium]MBU3987884.1 HDIG domain-containing protein [Gammaproteobacteria bacterium]MBU4004085.1 HDIG domain-containing protein [Gammaproteobacteria bacterium]MBU4020332.1 HDIG domain-containing protein [Gammaproteobacteria bacterium]